MGLFLKLYFLEGIFLRIVHSSRRAGLEGLTMCRITALSGPPHVGLSS